MITAQEFRNQYLGKAIDVDGAYGAQCVDLFKQVCYLAGMKPFALGGSGYAEEIVKRYQPLGLNAYFTLVSLSNAQYGDWIVWSKGSHDCPDSHVAMFIRMDGVNRVMVFGQNQFGKAYGNEGSISTHGIIGVLRFKAWSIQSTRKTNEELAQEVIEGLWGNGSERKSRLISAGYDYDAIQAIVNQKINDNVSKLSKTIDQLADEVILGKWGNGKNRISRLKKAGYSPSTIQTRVNQKLK
ncbi:MAG: hypothetical protein HFF01_05385 [Erysipelotrichaceae bacterium]|nr:hypothetical protein [Erysipelotrichaceae bacterium]